MSTRKHMPRLAASRPIAAFLLLTFCLDVPAGSRQRAVAVSPPSASDLSLTFVDAGPASTAVLDAGTISWRGGSERVTATTRRFGVRIGAATREPRGTATVRAYLEHHDPRVTIRIDGIVLGAAPRVIQRNAPIGIPVVHRLDIEVPANAPEGPLATTIGWEVTTE